VEKGRTRDLQTFTTLNGALPNLSEAEWSRLKADAIDRLLYLQRSLDVYANLTHHRLLEAHLSRTVSQQGVKP
jgi:hypothetical protein